MATTLFPFQKEAVTNLRDDLHDAVESYTNRRKPQIISYCAPTGAGKTIILSSLFENIFFGDDRYPELPNSIFVWLSDSPELNEQSRNKIATTTEKIKYSQCIMIEDASFDQEVLDDGYIYFLNTQKLSKSSNLTKHGDGRTYTIWETLANTVAEKYDHLFFVIDEAHRGMHDKDEAKATSIMQKFIKGSPEDNLPQMPIIIGMSATPARFNSLIAGTTSTIHTIITSTEEVRRSGLLKDRIIITYPETSTEVAVLKAATQNWMMMCDHWQQYCYEQHYAHVNPILLVQVLNGHGDAISDTDLDYCLKTIEETTGTRFNEHEVVHAFGQTEDLIINGLKVHYCEPSKISDDRSIKVVLFKESLSTGWDCPRAETMVSFRHAEDSTYIAQLLGRMIRTPMQMHITVDDLLNEVHLFLPFFDNATVTAVVEALQNSEGGELPVAVEGESIDHKRYEIGTTTPKQQSPVTSTKPGSPTQNTSGGTKTPVQKDASGSDSTSTTPSGVKDGAKSPSIEQYGGSTTHQEPTEDVTPATNPRDADLVGGAIDRDAIVDSINDMALLTYKVRKVKITNYRQSLMRLAGLVTRLGLDTNALSKTIDEITSLIHDHMSKLKQEGRYEDLANKVKQFKMTSEVFDVFGQTVETKTLEDFFDTTSEDIDRQFQYAEQLLNREGIGIAYLNKYEAEKTRDELKIDVIIFANLGECMESLEKYADEHFHTLHDNMRPKTVRLSESDRDKYNRITADGDVVSKHNFVLPKSVRLEYQKDGEKYTNHLYVNDDGVAHIKLNTWEKAVIDQEIGRSDFVSWYRNPVGSSESLCIPYKMKGEIKRMYPDFLIIRNDGDGGYIVDIMEPHDSSRTDNLPKAQGFAEYAKDNVAVGKIQLIRVNGGKVVRLDLTKSAVREAVIQASSNEILDDLFEKYGIIE